MRVKRLVVAPEKLFEMLTDGFHSAGYSVIENAVPRDAKLVNVRHAWPNSIEILIESAEFPEVQEGDQLLDLIPLMRREVPVNA